MCTVQYEREKDDRCKINKKTKPNQNKGVFAHKKT
jgi:hypothetical protein